MPGTDAPEHRERVGHTEVCQSKATRSSIIAQRLVAIRRRRERRSLQGSTAVVEVAVSWVDEVLGTRTFTTWRNPVRNTRFASPFPTWMAGWSGLRCLPT